MRKYNQFILEKLNEEIKLLLEGQLHASSDFLRKLFELSLDNEKTGEIARFIRKFIEDEQYIEDDEIAQNFFDTTDKVDMVSFMMNNKIPEDWDSDDDAGMPYSMGRSEMKIGKLVRYIINAINTGSSVTTFRKKGKLNVSDSELEAFVNAYKASESSSNWEFRLVKGEEIAKYYNNQKYFNDKGNLGSSCMAEKGKKTFMLYTQNETKVQLLILIDKETDKICGRALVWKLKNSPCEAKFFMDRVYSNNDSDVVKFKKFTNERGFIYKKIMNSHTSDNVEFVYGGKDVYGEITVKLDGDVDKAPFVDTLCFLNKQQTTISNLPSKDCSWLHYTDGSYGECGSCKGKCFEKEGFYIKVICENCGDGHIALKKRGIETPINMKYRLPNL
jgi:hypothetical protein